jgi:CDP-2,3-bis-(O-geranylgeranyl)-sn-glycerol synthase
MTLTLQLLWLALPVIASGLVHLIVMKLDLLPALRRMPMDFGRTFGGRRILGDNKTWRGAIVTIGSMTIAAWLLAKFNACCWNLPTLVPFAEEHPVVWGLLLGTGYIAGELPNSFTKRQFDIPPGGTIGGFWGGVLWLVDQLDSLAGMLFFVFPVWQPSLSIVALLVVVMLIAHPIGAWIMVLTGLKTRIG